MAKIRVVASVNFEKMAIYWFGDILIAIQKGIGNAGIRDILDNVRHSRTIAWRPSDYAKVSWKKVLEIR